MFPTPIGFTVNINCMWKILALNIRLCFDWEANYTYLPSGLKSVRDQKLNGKKKNINVDFLLRFDYEGTSFLSWAKQLLHMFGSCSCLLQTKRAHGTLINSCPRHRHKTYNCFHSNQTQLRDIVGVWKKHFSYVLPRRLGQLVITVKVHLPLKRFIGSAGTFFTLLIDP